MWSGAASDAPDSWVDEDVEHVNDDVDDDEGQCHRDGDALDDVHVVTGDALEEMCIRDRDETGVEGVMTVLL